MEFNTLPAGDYYPDFGEGSFGRTAFFASSNSMNIALGRAIMLDEFRLTHLSKNKVYGMSCRCIKNESKN